MVKIMRTYRAVQPSCSTGSRLVCRKASNLADITRLFLALDVFRAVEVKCRTPYASVWSLGEAGDTLQGDTVIHLRLPFSQRGSVGTIPSNFACCSQFNLPALQENNSSNANRKTAVQSTAYTQSDGAFAVPIFQVTGLQRFVLLREKSNTVKHHPPCVIDSSWLSGPEGEIGHGVQESGSRHPESASPQ